MADGKRNLTQWTTTGVIVGVVLGVAVSLVTGQWFWLAIGVAIGVILGIALNAAQHSPKKGGSATPPDRDPA